MGTRWEEYKKKNGVTPLDVLNPNTQRAPEGVAATRYDVCLSCEELINITKQCKKCGCFMVAKTRLLSAKCPLGKW
jgi:hypothetical protein